MVWELIARAVVAFPFALIPILIVSHLAGRGRHE